MNCPGQTQALFSYKHIPDISTWIQHHSDTGVILESPGITVA